MSLNESIVEDAALIMPAATLIPAFSQKEKERRNGIPGEARATGKHYLQVRVEGITL